MKIGDYLAKVGDLKLTTCNKGLQIVEKFGRGEKGGGARIGGPQLMKYIGLRVMHLKQDQDTWLCQTPTAGWGRKRGTDGRTDGRIDRPTKPFVGRPPGSGNQEKGVLKPKKFKKH